MALTLETDRLILRPLHPDDFEAHAAMMADPRVARFLALGGQVPSRESMWRAFATMLGHWTIRGYGFFAIVEKASGAFVGRAGPWMPEGWPGLECGWGVDAAHWGKGYAPMDLRRQPAASTHHIAHRSCEREQPGGSKKGRRAPYRRKIPARGRRQPRHLGLSPR